MRNRLFVKKNSVLFLGIVSLMFMSCSHVEKTYYPSGGIESEVSFWGGKMDGKAVWYYENGSIRMEVEYVKGRLQGPCVRYYRNGKPEVRCNYCRDTLDGEYLQYDERGWLSERLLYRMGVKNGQYLCYHDGEQKKIEGAFLENQFDGVLTYYDEQGFVIGKGSFVKGDGVLEYFDDQNCVRHRVTYAGSVKDGPESFFDGEGREYRTDYYENDRFVRSEENN